MIDWDLFDKIIDAGNGPYRSVFDKVLRQGDPLPTGVPFLDHYLDGGLHPGVLNVVAGRTAHGKTLLTRTCLMANRNKRILYLFADEDKEMVLFDLIGSLLNRRGYQIKADFKHPASDWTSQKLEKVVVDNFPLLYIPDTDMLGASISDVAAVVDQAERYWGAPADLIVFDYLGCLDIEAGDTSVQGLVHMREHKKLCRMFSDSVWLIISQLSRQGSRAEAPKLDRLFGGGEAAIDGCAIGVWRFDDRTPEDTRILLNIMKAKQGRAYPGGPGKIEHAGDNPNNNPHVHQITEASTIYPKVWPPVEEYQHPRGLFDDSE